MQERRARRAQAQANEEASRQVFVVGGQELERVSHFKYLGRILSDDDDDWPAVKANINKARQRWGQVSRILAREGATARTMGYFYKAVVQAVLLYASESWVLTERAKLALNSFHHKCARYIAGEHIQQRPNGEWSLPSSSVVLEKCGLFSMEEYIGRRKETIEAFVTHRPIFQACLDSIASAGNVNQKVWWE